MNFVKFSALPCRRPEMFLWCFFEESCLFIIFGGLGFLMEPGMLCLGLQLRITGVQ